MKIKLSIKTKLIPVIILLVLVPAALTSFISIVQNKKLVMEKVNELTFQVAKEKSEYIDSFITRMINETSIIANSDQVKNKDILNLSAILKSVKETDKNVLTAYVGTQDTEMFLYPYTELPKGFDPSQRDWYKEAVAAGGSAIITKPYQDAGTGKQVITVAIAFKTANGRDAVAGVDIDITNLTEEVSKTKVGKSGYACLVISDGTIIAHPNQELILTNITEKYKWGKDIVSKKSGNENYNFNKVNLISGFNEVKQAGWIVIVNMPESDFSAALTKSILTILIILGIFVGVSIFASIITISNITKPISRLCEIMKKVEDGDLSVEIKSNRNDEIGMIERGFGNMIQSQREVISSIINSSRDLLESSKEMMRFSKSSVHAIENIDNSTEQISSATETNAASLEEANAGVEEMASSAQTVTIAMQTVKEKGDFSLQVADEGHKSVGMAASSMEEIKVSVNNVVTVVEELNEASKEIDIIINTITSIAQQTNLLALNAAIEAARAGEAGKGFSVVAEEVRKLAEESSSAASNIGKLIQDIQNKVNGAVETTKEEIQLVDKGMENANGARDALNEIVESIKSLDKYINDASQAAEQQSAASEEMMAVINNISISLEESVKNVSEMAASTKEQKNTIGLLEEAAVSAENIAKKLSAQIQRFKV